MAWEHNLAESKVSEMRIKNQIEELMAEQKKKLAEILRPNRYVHVRPKNPFRLLKMELFGEQVHLRRIQFEWPTDKIFELMPEKETVRIQSLTLKSNA